MNSLSETSRALIDRFEAAYNSIDRHLRRKLNRDLQIPFSALIREAGIELKIHGSDMDLLRIAGDLRNILVHGRTSPGEYPAVPTQKIVESLENVWQRVTKPRLAIPTFGRVVTTKQKSDALTDVLRSIRENDYSQYPIYDNDAFVGLLTENGITRWLADHSAPQVRLVDLAEATIGAVLRLEEAGKRNFQFCRRDSTVVEIRAAFSSQELLEAVLVTANGKPLEKLLGIATRWDLLRVHDTQGQDLQPASSPRSPSLRRHL